MAATEAALLIHFFMSRIFFSKDLTVEFMTAPVKHLRAGVLHGVIINLRMQFVW